jgi:hypothetical protein
MAKSIRMHPRVAFRVEPNIAVNVRFVRTTLGYLASTGIAKRANVRKTLRKRANLEVTFARLAIPVLAKYPRVVLTNRTFTAMFGSTRNATRGCILMDFAIIFDDFGCVF